MIYFQDLIMIELWMEKGNLDFNVIVHYIISNDYHSE